MKEKEHIRRVTEAYESLLAEYDSDEIGCLEFNAGGGTGEWIEEGSLSGSEEEEAGGANVRDDDIALLRDVENDTYIQGLLDDHLMEKNDEVFMSGTR